MGGWRVVGVEIRQEETGGGVGVACVCNPGLQ